MNEPPVTIIPAPEPTLEERIRNKLDEIQQLTVNELQDLYYAYHGRATRSRNRRWLIKRLSYTAQEILSGRTLSPSAKRQAKKLSKHLRVRTRLLPDEEPVLPPVVVEKPKRDPRLPPPGSIIRRAHRGEVHEILVLENGFDYEGRFYSTLSKIAREVTGTSWNGYVWAGLSKRKSKGFKEKTP